MSSQFHVGDRFTIKFDEKWKRTEIIDITPSEFKFKIYDSELIHTIRNVYRKPDWINLIMQQRVRKGPWINTYPSWFKISETILCISIENKEHFVGVIANFCDNEWISLYHITYNYLNKNYKHIKQLKYEKMLMKNIKKNNHQHCIYNQKYVLFLIPEKYKISPLNIEVQMMNYFVSQPTIQYKQNNESIYKCQKNFEFDQDVSDEKIVFYRSVYFMKELHNETLINYLKTNSKQKNNSIFTDFTSCSIAVEINCILNELDIFSFEINDLISSYLHESILYICPPTDSCKAMEIVSYVGQKMREDELPFILGCEFVLNCDIQIIGFEICLDGIVNVLDQKIYLVKKYKNESKNKKIKIFETNREILGQDFNRYLFDTPVQLDNDIYQIICKLNVLRYAFEWHKLHIPPYERLYKKNNWKCFEYIDWFECDYRVYNIKTGNLAFDKVGKKNKRTLHTVPHIGLVIH